MLSVRPLAKSYECQVHFSMMCMCWCWLSLFLHLSAGRFRPATGKALSDYQKAIKGAKGTRNSVHEFARDSKGRDGSRNNGSNRAGPDPMPPRNIVIAGWCGSIDYVVDGMSAFAPEGSNVTVICECPPTVGLHMAGMVQHGCSQHVMSIWVLSGVCTKLAGLVSAGNLNYV